MLAIHNRPGSFSDKWIEFCKKEKVSYKIVDCYSSDIIQQLNDCSGLMWHWGHNDYKAVLFARQLTYSLESSGINVFPSCKTSWHYDDKVGQKYFLESVDAPLIASYVFYDKSDALEWIRNTEFPKVFKLRGGAGAENVHMAHSVNDAARLIHKAFGKGFRAKNRIHFLKERLWHFKRDKNVVSFLNIGKGLARLVLPKPAELHFPTEKNYAYFQDFIPNNECDIRIIVIGKRAFGIKRMVREGDFRASGSGKIIYNPEEIPRECIELAFKITEKIGAQTLAYDFVFDQGEPLIVEISYSFARKGYLQCPGYWNDKLEWIEGLFFPEFFMIEDFYKQCEQDMMGTYESR